MENREGSSATPKVPEIPPVRAWLIWQATPFTLGSSKACTQILSLEPTSFQVVVKQPISSDWAGSDKKTTINVLYVSIFFIKI